MRAAKRKSKIKMRKATRYFYIAIACIVFAVSSLTLFGSFLGGKTNKTKEQIYSYTNKYNYNYNVNMLPNKYMDQKELGMNEVAYVTSLIDNINLELNYNYNSSEKSTIKYKYNIKGVLSAVYTRDGEEQKVLTKEEIIKDNTENVVTEKAFNINEPVVIDLKEHNKLIKDFEQEIGFSVDAVYTIMLEVNAETTVEGEKVLDKYTSNIAIDVGKKTTTIVGDNNQEDTEFVSREIEHQVGTSSVTKAISGVFFVISVIMLYYISTKTVTMNKTRNEFRQELNRILRLCQDKIVQVSSKLEVDTTNVIDVKDFGEIVKVSEELFKPILYWISPRNDEAWFTVMSNGVSYRYILKK